MVYLVIRKIEREFEQRARIGSRVAGDSLRVEECMGRSVTDQPFPFFFWIVIWLRVEDGTNEINYHIFKRKCRLLTGYLFSWYPIVHVLIHHNLYLTYSDLILWCMGLARDPNHSQDVFFSLSYLTTRVLLILQHEYFFTHTCERFGQFCKGLWSSSPSN